MQILAVADLHDERPWYDWLFAEASSRKHDLIVVAGDFLLNRGGDGRHLHRQILFHLEWFKKMAATGQALAFCSGNHDLSGPESLSTQRGFAELVRDLGLSLIEESWMNVARAPGIVGPEFSGPVETRGGKMIVSCLPWRGCHVEMERLSDLPDFSAMKAAKSAQLRTRRPWVVVVHEPPAPSRVSLAPTANYVRALVEEFEPDLVVSGHYHDTWRIDGRSEVDSIGKTICLNPGRREGPAPRVIIHQLD